MNKDKLYNKSIQIKSIEDLKIIQNFLFELGFKWYFSKYKIKDHIKLNSYINIYYEWKNYNEKEFLTFSAKNIFSTININNIIRKEKLKKLC